ncbi:STAS domain-containing protein [Nocardioides hankookensis]|uniref:STAS domain-containing protein n=1 Tax=Nocardioides hankookensis TaxID=443157 RepID=A0ABW1LIR0_9ACTN
MDVSDFVTVVRVEPPAALLVVTGELDAFTTFQVHRQANDAVANGCADLRIDLSGVTFIDASGIGLLVRLRVTAAQHGGRLEIVAASTCVLRLCALLGLSGVFALRPESPRIGGRTTTRQALRRIRPRWRSPGIA